MNFRVPQSTGLAMSALALVLLCAPPSLAEFPPEGALPDAQNPAIATGDYPSPASSGAKAHYVFYFDCGKRMWIGVAATAVGEAVNSSPHGREFPPGPPTGAKRDSANPNRASNITTAETFIFANGVWIDAKTHQVARSAKLCPDRAAPSQRSAPIEPPAPVTDERPDKLPPPPVVKTNGESRVQGK